MDATTVAVVIGGIAQPYVRALLARWTGLDKDQNAAATALIALLIAVIATWATGGFADMKLPHTSIANPAPLVAYLWPKWASVYAISHLVFAGTQGAVHSVAAAKA